MTRSIAVWRRETGSHSAGVRRIAVLSSSRPLTMSSSALISRTGSGSIKKELARSLRRRKLHAFLLVAPLLFFILLMFAYPIGGMLLRSFYSPGFAQAMPVTAATIGVWSGEEPPPEEVWAALARDLQALQQQNAAGPGAAAVNVEL